MLLTKGFQFAAAIISHWMHLWEMNSKNFTVCAFLSYMPETWLLDDIFINLCGQMLLLPLSNEHVNLRTFIHMFNVTCMEDLHLFSC